jgi:putative membrane protein
MARLKLIAALTAVLLSIIVILQNTQPVETKFLFATITMPNAALLGLTLLIGIAVGIVVALALFGKREPKK